MTKIIYEFVCILVWLDGDNHIMLRQTVFHQHQNIMLRNPSSLFQSTKPKYFKSFEQSQ